MHVYYNDFCAISWKLIFYIYTLTETGILLHSSNNFLFCFKVIVYDDMGHVSKQQTDFGLPNQERNTCLLFGRILQYCECPQYLRKSLIPIHKDLQFCGLINPLDAPHHLRQSDDFPYRYVLYILLSHIFCNNLFKSYI